MLRKKKVRDKMSKKGFDNTDTEVRKKKERNEDRKKIVRKKNKMSCCAPNHLYSVNSEPFK